MIATGDNGSGTGAYIAVTAAYWSFMLSDGALRMLVLLHFHILGFTPFQLAYLFILYELAGIITNFCAGWLAARFGLSSTLYAGLIIQIVALLALVQLDSSWTLAYSLVFVMAVQGASGVAKDLIKMSSKSAVKLLAPDSGASLFRWVAILTGSKNAVKGLGFLLGAVLLSTLGFHSAVLTMAIILSIVLLGLLLLMPTGLPGGIKGSRMSDVLSTPATINWLSLARVFLFGARDVWFVVGIPVYFYSVLSDGTEAANRQAFFLIGSFMALWIILYGFVQGMTPTLLSKARQTIPDAVSALRVWAVGLLVVLFALSGVATLMESTNPWLTWLLIAGLLVFGAVFAVNSSLHSYLILAFTADQRVTMDVGFYYMANAAGRLLGTLLSGISYQWGGLALCLATATAMLMLSALSVQGLVLHLRIQPHSVRQ